jgi:hypothetical protein
MNFRVPLRITIGHEQALRKKGLRIAGNRNIELLVVLFEESALWLPLK